MLKNKSLNRGHGFKPSKRLGQHFLKDFSVIRDIIDRAEYKKSDHILEIGPGMGALTIPLSERVEKIVAVEKDPRLVELLGKKLLDKGILNVVLINDDILKLDLRGAIETSSEKIKVIGNLPYNISSPFLEKLINHRDLIREAVLMLQYEFARRLLSQPGVKDYGGITVLTRYNASIKRLFEVSREAFHPRPKVGSMVISVNMGEFHPRRAVDEELFKKVVKGAFAHRRKTVLNSLKGTLKDYEGEKISIALKDCGIDPRRRAETIDIEEYLSLTATLKRMHDFQKNNSEKL